MNKLSVVLLQATRPSRSDRMLLGAADRAVDAQVPDFRALGVGQGLNPGEDLMPGSVPLPPAEQVVRPRPRPEYSTATSRHGSPVRTR